VSCAASLILESFGVFAVFCCVAHAQITQFEGKPIVNIQFSDVQPLDPVDLAKAQPLKVGQPLRMSEVAEAIDGLFATGRFDDIAVEGEASGNGVTVRFVTKNTWFVGGVMVRGKVMDPPNRGQVASSAQFSLGTPFHEEDLKHAQDNIKHLMEANGLYEAQVTPFVERSSNAQEVFITLQVKEGKRAKYDTPAIQGDTRLSNDTILRVTGWRIPIIHWWRQVTDARTRKGVHSLLAKYQKQDRLTAHVELKKLDYDATHRRVHPNLSVDTGPKIEVRAVEARLSKRVLKRYVPVFEENSVDKDLLVEGKRNLHDYLQSQGYYDVDVDFRVVPGENDVETIEYVISRGQRYKLVNLTIAGNKYFDQDAIRERMFMEPASFRMRHGRYSEAFNRKDEENIANLYRANGFRDVKVTSAVDRNYRNNPGDIAVTVKIDEGPQWFVDSLVMRGVNQVNADEVRSQLASIAGQPFSDVSLASDRDTVLTYYYARGFPGANFNASWQVNGQPQHVNVIYTIVEGDRQYVRHVITSGLHTTRQSVVDKQLTLKAGDPLSPIEQTQIQKKFYDLGIFARVDTAIENPDGQTDHKYILYNFDEANRYNLTLGVGAQVARFGTPSTTDLSAPGGTTGFSPEFSATLSRLNFLGLGHTVSLRGSYSTIEKRASISYFQPRFLNAEGRDITYTILYDDSLNVRTFASRREEASVQLSQKFSKSLTGLFRFSYRRDSVSSIVIPVLLIPQLLQPVRLGIVSANFVQDRRDNPADPHHGIYNTADVGVTGKFFGSQRSFGRVLLRNATYYKLTRNVVLARQTQFGVIRPFSAPAGVSDQESVPLPERFFSGGADSLRAFPYNQAGPRDTGAPLVPGGVASPPTGFPLGGNALFANNVELRFPFIGENIQGVIFHDMGNVYSSVSNISFRFHQKNLQDFDYAVHAAGFGVRYRTPIGPIRGDLAYSINPPSFVGFKGTPAQLLQCNPSLPTSALPGFCQPVSQGISHFQFFFSIGQTF
jgi:outer membrane protein assembly complex protein YaeT